MQILKAEKGNFSTFFKLSHRRGFAEPQSDFSVIVDISLNVMLKIWPIQKLHSIQGNQPATLQISPAEEQFHLTAPPKSITKCCKTFLNC